MLTQRLREARERAGLSRWKLSRLAGLSDGHVALIESGQRRKCEAETLAALARVLEVSVEWLLGQDQPTDGAAA